MASPQIEEGYTKIANAILEALTRIRIPGESMQILLTVLRKTYGFNKKEDIISLSQFNLYTGIAKTSIIRGIKRLISMNLIYKEVNGNGRTYCINKDYSTWKPFTKKLIVYKEVNNRLQRSKFSFTKKLHTKESIKRKYQKKESTPSLKKLFDQKSEAYRLSKLLFDLILKNNPHSRLHAYKNEEKEAIIQRWAKDIDLLIHKDGQHPSIVEEVIRFVTADGFWGTNILSGAKLREKWDTLVAQMGKKKKAADEEECTQLDVAGNPLKKLRPRRNEEDDVPIDPATGNPAETIAFTSTRKSVQQKFREGLL